MITTAVTSYVSLSLEGTKIATLQFDSKAPKENMEG